MLQWMSRSTSSWTRNALRASPTVSTWWPPQISSCASTTLLWTPIWILWNATDFSTLYHLAGRHFNFEMLSGSDQCALFLCSFPWKFYLTFISRSRTWFAVSFRMVVSQLHSTRDLQTMSFCFCETYSNWPAKLPSAYIFRFLIMYGYFGALTLKCPL